jgi:hypothetical protein
LSGDELLGLAHGIEERGPALEYAWPAAVRRTFRVVRSSSRTPSRASSAASWRLTVGCERPSWRAAAERLPARTTAIEGLGVPMRATRGTIHTPSV